MFHFDCLAALWDVLDVSYKNPSEEEEARNSLYRLRQGNQPFGLYLAEFQRLYSLSAMSDDKTLISCMRNGVTNEIQSCISQHQDIHRRYTFDEYVSLCKDCVVRLELERPLSQRSPYPTSSRGPQSNPSMAGIGANVVPMGSDPMEFDQVDMSHIGPDGHLTPKERQRRRKFNLCMHCGGLGHRA